MFLCMCVEVRGQYQVPSPEMSLSSFETEVLIGQELLNEPGITRLQASPPPQHWGFKGTPLGLPLLLNMDFYIVLRSSRP